MALFRPQRPLRLLSLPRAPTARAYASPPRPSTAPKPVRQIVVPKPSSGSAPTIPAASTQTSTSPVGRRPIPPKSAAEKAPAAPQPKPLDPKSPEYKKKYNETARRWLAGLIALPVFIVTSYYLFDRLILGNKKKVLSKEGPADQRDPLAKTL